MILLISGRAGEGKTASANILTKLLGNNSYIVPIAQSLKEISREIGWDGKKDVRGRELLQNLGRVGREYNKDVWVSKTYESAILPLIEDGIGSNYVFIIDDWRFENEYNFLSSIYLPVVRLRVQRDPKFHLLIDSPMYNDISEVSLPRVEYDIDKGRNMLCEDSYYDFFIPNYRDLSSLEVNLKILLTKLESKNYV